MKRPDLIKKINSIQLDHGFTHCDYESVDFHVTPVTQVVQEHKLYFTPNSKAGKQLETEFVIVDMTEASTKNKQTKKTKKTEHMYITVTTST